MKFLVGPVFFDDDNQHMAVECNDFSVAMDALDILMKRFPEVKHFGVSEMWSNGCWKMILSTTP